MEIERDSVQVEKQNFVSQRRCKFSILIGSGCHEPSSERVIASAALVSCGIDDEIVWFKIRMFV